MIISYRFLLFFTCVSVTPNYTANRIKLFIHFLFYDCLEPLSRHKLTNKTTLQRNCERKKLEV